MNIVKYYNRFPPYTPIPNSLFANGEQGGLYIMSSLFRGKHVVFQDTAGNDPVTAEGQTVAMLMDLSGNGNHAVQSTAGSRPEYYEDTYGGYLVSEGGESLVATLPNLGSNATLFYATWQDGPVILTGQSISGSFDVLQNEDTYMVGCIDRALTQAEMDFLENYLSAYPTPADPGTAPVIEGNTSIAAENFQTDHVVPLPTGIVSGERLFVFITIAASDEITTPAGWDVVYDTTNQMTGICVTRLADGSEGSSVTFTGPAARVSTAVAVRVSGVVDFEPNWSSTGNDNPTTAHVPIFPAANGVMNYLWLACVHWRQGTRTVTQPSGYTLVNQADTGYDGAAENHISVAFINSETAELPAANWTSNQIDTEINNYITSLIALNG